MCSRPLAVIACAAASLALLSCARKPAPGTQRLAILRFENLSGDPGADWMGRAFSEIISDELSAVPEIYTISTGRLHTYEPLLGRRPAAAPGIFTERPLALAASANRIGYGEYTLRGDRLEARLTIEDPQTGRMSAVLSATAPAGDVVSAATALARQIADGAATYDTWNAAAVRGYVSAMESPGQEQSAQSLSGSIAADPNFAPPYRMLAQWKAQHNDREGALAMLDQALARGNAIAPRERARVELEAATLRNDAAARHSALLALSKLDPRDPNVFRTLAQSAMAAHDFKRAVEAYQKALAVDGEDVSSWNQLAYAAAYAGDLNTAAGALRRYQALRPNDPNSFDSMGDVNLLSGRLREAEGFYLEATKKDPTFANGADFFKAAMARLMTGDVAGADALAKSFTDGRSGESPADEYRRAEWLWISGRREAARQRMEAFARANETGALRELSSRAWGELAIWNLLVGERPAAEQATQKALSLATQQTAALAVVARFLLQPAASASEWRERADRLFTNPAAQQLKTLSLVYALLLGREFQSAYEILAPLNQSASVGSDENIPILLAWSLLETGRVKDAEPLLRWNPIPPAGGITPFMSFYFPRVYYLRAVAAEKSGNRAEVESNRRLFVQLSGPTPLIWDAEKK